MTLANQNKIAVSYSFLKKFGDIIKYFRSFLHIFTKSTKASQCNLRVGSVQSNGLFHGKQIYICIYVHARAHVAGRRKKDIRNSRIQLKC